MGKSSNRGALGCERCGDEPFTGACLDFLLSGGGGGLSRLCATWSVLGAWLGDDWDNLVCYWWERSHQSVMEFNLYLRLYLDTVCV